MSYRVFLGTARELSDILNGATVMGPFDRLGLPIGGKTLIFSSPVATVTFAGAAAELRTFAQIVADVKAQISDMVFEIRREDGNKLVLSMAKEAGYTVSMTGTANPVLGLSTTADTASTGEVGGSQLRGFNAGDVDGHYVLILDTTPNATPSDATVVSDGGGSLTIDTPQLPATLGQKTAALSISAVLASNQPAISVTAAQLAAALGRTTAAASPSVVLASDDHTKGQVGAMAVPAEAANTIPLGRYNATPPTLTDGQMIPPQVDAAGSQKIVAAQLPAALGQGTMAQSLTVALASNQSALPITDNSGSITIDSPAIPTTAGAKTSAASLGVVLASDQAAVPITDNAGSLTIDSPAIPTTAGAKTSAASLGVVLASDQAALPITDNAGSLTIDSPAIPTTAGAKTSAASLGVVLASDQAALPITDNAGSLTIDTPQLPTTIGQKAASASTSVVLASDDHTKGQGAALALASAAEAANTLPLARYNASAPTLTDGQVVVSQLDVNGNLKTRDQYGPVAEDETNGVYAVASLPISGATYAESQGFNAQVATNLIVKVTAGTVYRVTGYLDLALGAGTYYVCLLNEVSAVNGTRNLLRAPQKIVIPAVAVDMPFDFDCGARGVFASTGITVAVSTTAGNAATTVNLTLAGAQMIVTSARYK